MSLIIGIAGTAKNTGKTTTTSAILNELYKEKILVALTSIGYDGEEIDNITGLPKPRLFLKKNTILATAEKCLKVGSAAYNILETTDIITPLGKICIVRVVREGLAVVAGPNKGSQLKYVKDKMINDLDCKVVLVDGALNRIVPMIETDGIILATGASRNVNILALAQEVKALHELLNLTEASKSEQKYFSRIKKITLIPKNNCKKFYYLNYGSLIDDMTKNEIVKNIKDIKMIFIPALISESTLKKLNNDLDGLWANKTLIIRDPIKLIAGGNPEILLKQINKIRLNNGNVKVLKNLPLLAITVNPFFPKYRFDKGCYEPGYIDRNKLVETMRTTVDIPIIDIKYDGSSKIKETILNYLHN